MGASDGWAAMDGKIRDPLIDSAGKDLVMSLATASGARVPGIFKKASGRGCAVERGPPYVPELQPIDHVWK